MGEGGADRQSGAEHVGQHHRAPVLDRLLEEAAGGAEACVGEDGVDPAEVGQRPRRQRLDLVPLGDVALDGDRRLRAAQLGGQVLERLAPPRREYQAVPIGGQARRRGADSAARAGDQKYGFIWLCALAFFRHPGYLTLLEVPTARACDNERCRGSVP